MNLQYLIKLFEKLNISRKKHASIAISRIIKNYQISTKSINTTINECITKENEQKLLYLTLIVN